MNLKKVGSKRFGGWNFEMYETGSEVEIILSLERECRGFDHNTVNFFFHDNPIRSNPNHRDPTESYLIKDHHLQ